MSKIHSIPSFLVLGWLTVQSAVAGSIGGTLFADPNRNGSMDAGEAPIPGLRIGVLGSDGFVLRQTRSGADGTFLFSGLPDGDYVVSVLTGSRFRATHPLRAADIPPIDLPFGRPRYSAMPGLVPNLYRASRAGTDFRHVALGDSIGFGFNFCGSLLGEDGYIEPTTERLRRTTPVPVITDKQAIPGDETADLLDPDFDILQGFNDVFNTIDKNAPLVSISIGGNDFLGAEDGGDAAVAAALVIARKNLQEILSTLVSELPAADVEINSLYDNREGEDALHNLWAPIWNQVVRELAWGQEHRVTVAEVYPEYAHDEGGELRGETGLICHDFFGLDGIHPTNRGYDVHEQKLWQAFGGVSLAGDERLDFDLGFLPLTIRAAASESDAISGEIQSPEAGAMPDGIGALVSADNAELRLGNFLPASTPPTELGHAVLRIRYRTTAAPLDDLYVFEASIDGTFNPPGSTPATWNTIIPIVGSAGNGGAEPLAFPDQPDFRIVSAPLYLGGPTTGVGTLTWEDLRTLWVRVVTLPTGIPDGYSLEWDGAWVEIFGIPSGADPQAAEGLGIIASALERRDHLGRLLAREPDEARAEVSSGLASNPDDEILASFLAEICSTEDAPLVRRLLGSGSAPVRDHAVRAVGCVPEPNRSQLLGEAASDPATRVRLAAARELALSSDSASLLGRLAADPDARVRRLGIRGLARLEGTDEALDQALDNDPDAAVRVEAAAGLLEGGNDAGVELLFDALVASPPSVRARDVLARRAAEHPRVVAALEDPDPRARAWAAWLVGHSKQPTPSLLQSLRQLLANDEVRAQVGAMDALSRLGDSESAALIARLTADHRLAVNAVEALGRLPGPTSLQALAEIAGSSTLPTTARQQAARTLALAATPGNASLLKSLTESSDTRVRRLAESGMRRLQQEAR